MQYAAAGNFQRRPGHRGAGRRNLRHRPQRPAACRPDRRPTPDEDPLEQGDLVRRRGQGRLPLHGGHRTAVPAIYDEIRDNYNGLLLVRQGSKWGVLNGQRQAGAAPAVRCHPGSRRPTASRCRSCSRPAASATSAPRASRLTDISYRQAEPFPAAWPACTTAAGQLRLPRQPAAASSGTTSSSAPVRTP